MSDLAAVILTDLETALGADQLELPTPPEVALRIREEAESADLTGNSLAAAITVDPGLAASLMRVANSARFLSANAIDELPSAIDRMGLDYAAKLAKNLSMQQMFQATSELVDRKLRQTWQHASVVAAISAYLAKKYTQLSPDQAMLAGLTHSIGSLPILAWAEENDHLLRDSMTMDRVIDTLHGSIGTMILQHCEFPNSIALVPSHYLDNARHTATPDYISIVAVAANETARINNPSTTAASEQVSGYKHLNIDPSDLEFQIEINAQAQSAATKD